MRQRLSNYKEDSPEICSWEVYTEFLSVECNYSVSPPNLREVQLDLSDFLKDGSPSKRSTLNADLFSIYQL